MGDKREQEINKEIEIKSVKEKEKIFKYSILILNDRMTCSKRWNNISQLISPVSVINSVRNQTSTYQTRWKEKCINMKIVLISQHFFIFYHCIFFSFLVLVIWYFFISITKNVNDVTIIALCWCCHAPHHKNMMSSHVLLSFSH